MEDKFHNMKESLIFIEHILESIKNIEQYSKNMNKEKFLKNIQIQDAIIRRFEIIGEAVKNLPENLIGKHKEIEWNKIAGMRDKLIHHYFGMDLDAVWDTIEIDLPVLKTQILKIKKEFK